MKRIYLTIIGFLFTISLSFGQIEKVKSAFIYQFTKYIEWCPDYQTGDFVIGVLGDSPIIGELNTISQNKKVVNQAIIVKRFSDVQDISKCNILFIAEDMNNYFSSVCSKLNSTCTVIICEKEGMAQNGAAINFVENEGKIFFELNKHAFSSRLLKVNNQLSNLAKVSY